MPGAGPAAPHRLLWRVKRNCLWFFLGCRQTQCDYTLSIEHIHTYICCIRMHTHTRTHTHTHTVFCLLCLFLLHDLFKISALDTEVQLKQQLTAVEGAVCCVTDLVWRSCVCPCLCVCISMFVSRLSLNETLVVLGLLSLLKVVLIIMTISWLWPAVKGHCWRCWCRGSWSRWFI